MLPRTVLGYLIAAAITEVLAYANTIEFSLPNIDGQVRSADGRPRGQEWPLCYYVFYPGGFVSTWDLAAFDVSPAPVRIRPFYVVFDIVSCILVIVVL